MREIEVDKWRELSRKLPLPLFICAARATGHQDALRRALSARFIMYGEWLYAKQTIFYDRLARYFFEFDLFDRERELFLATNERREILAGLPVISAPVLFRGSLQSTRQLRSLISRSDFQSAAWRFKASASLGSWTPGVR